MPKGPNKKIVELYNYLSSKNKELILAGGSVEPTCYAFIFDNKDNFSILPIPIGKAQTSEQRRMLLAAMGGLLKREKAKVKAFMFSVEAWMSIAKKGDVAQMSPSEDPDRKECLIFSVRDCFDNVKYELSEIKRGNNIELVPVGKNDFSEMGWMKKGDAEKSGYNYQDTLLDTIWEEYRSIK